MDIDGMDRRKRKKLYRKAIKAAKSYRPDALIVDGPYTLAPEQADAYKRMIETASTGHFIYTSVAPAGAVERKLEGQAS